MTALAARIGEILELRRSGATLKAIARKIGGGCTYQAVWSELHRAGAPPLPPKYRVWTAEDDAVIRQMRAEGRSYGEIQKVLGCKTWRQVAGRAHRLGLTTPLNRKVAA